jgi:hypothetical protein
VGIVLGAMRDEFKEKDDELPAQVVDLILQAILARKAEIEHGTIVSVRAHWGEWPMTTFLELLALMIVGASLGIVAFYVWDALEPLWPERDWEGVQGGDWAARLAYSVSRH